MARSNRNPAIHPLQYVASTVVYTVFGAAVLGVLTVVMLTVAEQMGPPYPHLYVTALVGFALILSQEMFDEDITGRDVDESDFDELPVPQKLLVFASAVIFYNLLMFTALVVTALGVEFGLGRGVYLVAFLYPAYDVKTGSKMNPLSVLGFITWIVAGLSVLGWVSQTLVDLVREVELEPIRLIETLRYRPPG